MSLMLYQCPCGRQYNYERITICPACRLPYGQSPSAEVLAKSELARNTEVSRSREVLHEFMNQNSQVEAASPPSGWYPDPDGLPSDRYWDGSSWTESTRPQTVRPQAPTPQSFVPAQGRYAASTQRRQYTKSEGYRDAIPQNGFGVASLVLGIIGLFTPLIAPTLAVIFGYVALNRCTKGQATNRTMALWGVSLGWVAWALWVLWWFIVLNS